MEGSAAARAVVADCADCEDALIVTVNVNSATSAAAAAPEGVAGAAAPGGAAAGQLQGQGSEEAGEGWRALRVRVHLGYPQVPPVLLFGGSPAGLPSSIKVRPDPLQPQSVV